MRKFFSCKGLVRGVLGFDNGRPSCCLSIERLKTVLNLVFKIVHSGRSGGGGGSVGLVKALFLSCLGYRIKIQAPSVVGSLYNPFCVISKALEQRQLDVCKAQSDSLNTQLCFSEHKVQLRTTQVNFFFLFCVTNKRGECYSTVQYANISFIIMGITPTKEKG